MVKTKLEQAAQAVLDRWDSPQWKWAKHGPTADLMADLRAALAEPQQEQAPGWQRVPVYPTAEMIDAGRWSEYGEESSRLRPVDDDEVAGVWALMLAAAPQQGAKP
ncbi:hypothetical protein [Roseateles sp. PN1]|uniref:hypothetical protein n=1 Tax=Roseateles sp. PN1 TaxID=3137372 RepID=UPI00313963FE